jgi:hypothetical protein
MSKQPERQCTVSKLHSSVAQSVSAHEEGRALQRAIEILSSPSVQVALSTSKVRDS